MRYLPWGRYQLWQSEASSTQYDLHVVPASGMAGPVQSGSRALIGVGFSPLPITKSMNRAQHRW